MALIDYPDAWDARQILTLAAQQVWDETLAVIAPEINTRLQVIPQPVCDQVFKTPAMQMVMRVERRLIERHRELN